MVARVELFRVCALALKVIGANMQCKLFVSLQLEVAHHFIERCASGCTRGFESPATFGATKTPKTLMFNPHQFPIHGRLCRCAPRLSDRIASTRPSSRDETFSFGSGVLPDCSKNRYAVWAWRQLHKETGEVYQRQFWMVCRASYRHGSFLFVRTPDFGAPFEVAESLNYWSWSCVAVLAPSSKANVGYPTEALHLGEL
jgi:hypothetical protein